MKKKILSIGAALALTTPTVALISCFNTGASKNIDEGPTEAEKLEKLKQETAKRLNVKLNDAIYMLAAKRDSLEQVKSLPSDVVAIDGSNILTKIYQYTTAPELFKNISFKEITLKPNDDVGELEITFKLETFAKVKTETVTVTSDTVSAFFNYQTVSENHTFKIEQEMDALTEPYLLNKADEPPHPHDFYAIPFVTTTHLTMKEILRINAFKDFLFSGDPARPWIDDDIKHWYKDTPITEKSKIHEYSNLFGIDLYEDPRLKDKFKIVSIQAYDYSTGGTRAEWYLQKVKENSRGYIHFHLTLEKEGVQKTIFVLVLGFPEG